MQRVGAPRRRIDWGTDDDAVVDSIDRAGAGFAPTGFSKLTPATSATPVAGVRTAVAEAPMRAPVRIYVPCAALQPYVTFHYFVDVPVPLHDFLYPEWANVRFSVRGEWRMRLGDNYPDEPLTTPLFGATDKAAEVITPGGTTIGFGLTPLGWDRFFDMPANALANKVCDLGDLLGTPAEDIRQGLIADGDDDAAGVRRMEAVLLALLKRRPPNDPALLVVEEAMRARPASVPAFAEAAGMSERTLHRACLKLFGFTPKRVLRRQRFLDTLGLIRITEDPSFGALLDPEYCDQAHFSREFREFMGITATDYLRVPRPLMAAAAMAQEAAGVTLSFQLPPQPKP